MVQTTPKGLLSYLAICMGGMIHESTPKQHWLVLHGRLQQLLPEHAVSAATTSLVEAVWLHYVIALRIVGWNCPFRLNRLAQE